MRIAPLADVKARLSAYVDECGSDGPVVITRNGKAVAVLLVPSDDDETTRGSHLLDDRSMNAAIGNTWNTRRSHLTAWRLAPETVRCAIPTWASASSLLPSSFRC